MRFASWVLSAVLLTTFFLTVSVTNGQGRAGKKPITTAELESKIKQAIKAKSSFDFEETPLAEVMQRIQKTHNFNVSLDKSAEQYSLSLDTPITFAAKNLPLSDLLMQMLKPHNATFMIRDGVLSIISTHFSDEPEYFNREVIDCRRLLKLLNAPHAYKQNQTPLNAGGFSFDPVAPHQIAERILEGMIKKKMNAEDWDEGLIRVVAGCMVISQRQQKIEEIQKLVNEMTKKLSKQK